MNDHLTPAEIRVIGCLIEKEITTPEQYPLSLNALTNACNQKSNRAPVLNLAETEVQATLDELVRRRLVVEKSGFGSRVSKYEHRFCNTEFGTLHFSERELGVICELMLRGAQTPGELRAHTQRLCHVDDVHQIEATLNALMERGDGPFVARLAREPGRRESRYAQLFGEEMVATGLEEHPLPVGESTDDERLTRLEQEIAELREEVAGLRALLEGLTS